jgi:hypothetical protein
MTDSAKAIVSNSSPIYLILCFVFYFELSSANTVTHGANHRFARDYIRDTLETA